jgi:hypothetical protein
VSLIDGRHLRLEQLVLIFTEGPAARSRRPQKSALVRKRSDGQWGGDRGVRGSVRSGVRGRECLAPTRLTRQSGSGVVKCQVPQSPGSGCKPMAQGRSASSEEMLGTDEARVLVVEAVGSRSRSIRIEVVLRGVSQGKPQKDYLAWSKPSKPLMRAMVAVSVKPDRLRQVEWWGAQAFARSAEALDKPSGSTRVVKARSVARYDTTVIGS